MASPPGDRGRTGPLPLSGLLDAFQILSGGHLDPNQFLFLRQDSVQLAHDLHDHSGPQIRCNHDGQGPPPAFRPPRGVQRHAITDRGVAECLSLGPRGRVSCPEPDPGDGYAETWGDSISHGPHLRLELGVTLQSEIATTLAALPRPGFVRLSRQDDDSADFFPGNAVQGDGDELAACGHGESLAGLS